MDENSGNHGDVSKKDEAMMGLSGDVQDQPDTPQLTKNKTKQNETPVLNYPDITRQNLSDVIQGSLAMQINNPENPISFRFNNLVVTIPAGFITAKLLIDPIATLNRIYDKRMTPEQQSEFISQLIKLGSVWRRINEVRSKVTKISTKEGTEAAWQRVDFDQLKSDLDEFSQNEDLIRELVRSDGNEYFFSWVGRTQKDFDLIREKFSVKEK